LGEGRNAPAALSKVRNQLHAILAVTGRAVVPKIFAVGLCRRGAGPEQDRDKHKSELLMALIISLQLPRPKTTLPRFDTKHLMRGIGDRANEFS
jgi:hypothetical protein